MVNRSYLFRRALKLVNGGLASFATPGVIGLTIVTENPVYVQGDWNWNSTADLTDPHAATSVIADAVTLLSSDWTDTNAFLNPYIANNRPRVQNWYRLAIIGGKGTAFPWPRCRQPGYHVWHRRRRAQLPPLSGNGQRHDELPGRDRDVLLQPPGSRHL